MKCPSRILASVQSMGRRCIRVLSTHRRGMHDACEETCRKKGAVIGVYETPCPGEYKFTSSGCKMDEASGGKIHQCLKRSRWDFGKSPVLVMFDVCPDLHAVGVAGLGKEDAGCNEAECRDEAKENARIAAGLGAIALQENDVEEMVLDGFGCASASAEGAILATWSYQELKDPTCRLPEPDIDLYDETEDSQGWCNGVELANAQNFCRKLEETPANIMKPANFAETAVKVLCPLNVHVEVRDSQWLETHKMNGLLTVGKGSCEPPFFLEMTYCGGEEGEKPVVLLGKGVTFDSGSLDLKSNKKMVSDGVLGLAGGAVVVGVMKGLAALKVPINVNGVVPLCENMPGGQSMRPGDVVLSQSGRTVLIERVEHEGEVILADALSFSKEYNPCFVITVAAFCNSVRETLGAPASAAFCTSNSVWMEVMRAAAETGDRFWRLPLWKAYQAYINEHKSVDLTNLGIYPGGDPCASAAFLKEFAPCCDFLHVDIAGTGGMTQDDSSPYLRRGLRTGRPVRTLIQLLYQLACPQKEPSPAL